MDGRSTAHKMGTALRLLGIGWYVALCIVGGGLVGVWLDGWLDLEQPVFRAIGLLAGVALAVFGMYRMLMAVLAGDADSTDGTEG